MYVHKQVLEFYFTSFPTLGCSIFLPNIIKLLPSSGHTNVYGQVKCTPTLSSFFLPIRLLLTNRYLFAYLKPELAKRQ